MTEDLDRLIQSTLDERELVYQRPQPGRFFVTLPGTKKLQTNCWLMVGEHALVVEAFVCRRPDEAHEDVYRFLLRRNAKLYGVHYTLDASGDIFLLGRVGLDRITVDELDRLLGQVLEAADGDFNSLLELGFASSIRREWKWRTSRGESLANLAAFEHLARAPGERGRAGGPPEEPTYPAANRQTSSEKNSPSPSGGSNTVRPPDGHNGRFTGVADS